MSASRVADSLADLHLLTVIDLRPDQKKNTEVQKKS
jgi:hypothetical protein